MVKICEYCGKEFKSKGKKPKFCCKECSLKARSLKSSKVKVKCIYCGKELERYPSEIRNEVYCSKECLAKYTKENSSVTYKCEICNKTVTTKKSYYDKDERDFVLVEQKVVKNDKGEIVPETCDKCGGKVVVQIHGEPVYICKDCGKYFGTVPFTLKENIESEETNSSQKDIYKEVNAIVVNPFLYVNGEYVVKEIRDMFTDTKWSEYTTD